MLWLQLISISHAFIRPYYHYYYHHHRCRRHCHHHHHHHNHNYYYYINCCCLFINNFRIDYLFSLVLYTYFSYFSVLIRSILCDPLPI